MSRRRNTVEIDDNPIAAMELLDDGTGIRFNFTVKTTNNFRTSSEVHTVEVLYTEANTIPEMQQRFIEESQKLYKRLIGQG